MDNQRKGGRLLDLSSVKGRIVRKREDHNYVIVSPLDENSMIEEISASGLRMTSDSLLRLSTHVELGFYLPSSTKSVTLIGKIVRKSESTEKMGGKYAYGVSTVHISERDKVRLSEYILAKKSQNTR